MGGRPRHPDKNLAKLLKEAEQKKWLVEKGRKYYGMRCPCGKHLKTVKITPSGPDYERNLRGWLRRTGCWED